MAITAGFLVELDGTICGAVRSVDGGDGFADVIQEPPLLSGKKHVGPPQWDDLKLQTGPVAQPHRLRLDRATTGLRPPGGGSIGAHCRTLLGGRARSNVVSAPL